MCVSISGWTQIQLGPFVELICALRAPEYSSDSVSWLSWIVWFIYLAMIQQKEGKKCRKHKDFTPPQSSQLHTPDRLISFLSKGIRPLWCHISKTRMFSHKTFASVLGKTCQTSSRHAERGPAQALAHNVPQLAQGDAVHANIFNACTKALNALCAKAAELQGSRRCSSLQARMLRADWGRGWQLPSEVFWVPYNIYTKQFLLKQLPASPDFGSSLPFSKGIKLLFPSRSLGRPTQFLLIPLLKCSSALTGDPSQRLQCLLANDYFHMK